MKILVTGASGFIGLSLVPHLVRMGHSVRTLGRANSVPSKLAQLPLEHFPGDVTNPEQVTKAVSGCDMVYHLAGLVSYRKRDASRQYAVNVMGTRNVMKACLDAKVERVVHTSSVAALGIPPKGEIGTETIEYNLSGKGLSYCDTKHQAEVETLAAHKDGLNVIILCPGIIFGEGDTHPHHHAIFATMSKGSMIGVPGGGVTFSDINDVVAALLACLDHGTFGERYAVVSANLSFRDAALAFAKVFNTHTALFTIPGPLLVAAGMLAEDILPNIGVNPPLTRQNAWLSQHDIFFSSAKASQDLKISFTSFEDTIKRTAPYYLGKTLVPSGAPST